MGHQVALCTLLADTVAHMPCNPAIGGTAKGHLVREIDAIGGLMAEAADATGIQFKLLNRSRGPAVWSPRAQADKRRYGEWVRTALQREPGITWICGKADEVTVEGAAVTGLRLEDGRRYRCGAVVITTGTFLNGLMHIGRERHAGGRMGAPASTRLAESLKAFGFTWGRLKTGTPPRLHRNSIDFDRLCVARGDKEPVAFSFMTNRIERSQINCHSLSTNERVHELVRQHIDESPLFNGQIRGIGPRYCPSLEDKVVRFPERERHQIFLEPEGLDVDEIYVNGFSMSLPREVQADIVHSLPGCEEAVLMRPGYAVEYDFIQPTELRLTLESKRIAGLYLAGQVNGTSGYEEAAGQGLIAGINAALKVGRQPPFSPGRSEAYLGVLIDDLTTKGCLEPYRMFTSRAEHRLLLRIDNADLRLTAKGRELGLVDEARWERFQGRRERFDTNLRRLQRTTVTLVDGKRVRAAQALRKPAVWLSSLLERGELELNIEEKTKAIDISSLETEVKYEGYLKRQRAQVERDKHDEDRMIPADFEFRGIPGLSNEVVQRLSETRPENLGQAQRVPGVTPAAVAVIGAFLNMRGGSARRGSSRWSQGKMSL